MRSAEYLCSSARSRCVSARFLSLVYVVASALKISPPILTLLFCLLRALFQMQMEQAVIQAQLSQVVSAGQLAEHVVLHSKIEQAAIQQV